MAVLIAGAISAGCASFVGGFSGRTEACKILSIGVPATATIERLIDTGTTINNDPVVEFVLRVLPSEGPAFEAHSKALVSRLDVPSVQAGRVVPVQYDPQDTSRVALELWDCPKQ
ncbi:MAG: DUF3592 domain-containing protein [Rudaea sp.]